jgi:GAF domain-containing protein
VGLLRSDDAAARGARDRFRADVSQLLDAALDPRATLDGVARLAVPDLAELCVVDLLQDGQIQGAGVASAVNPEIAERIRALRATVPLDPQGPHPVAVAARTGQVQFVPSADDEQLRAFSAGSEVHLQTMRELRYSAAIIVPLIARGRTLGVLSLLHLGDRRYTQDDLAAVIEVAGRAALAIDNARLFAELRSVEAQQEAILAGMGQSVTAQDREGRLVFANQAAADALGAGSPEELMLWTAADLDARIVVTDEHGRPVEIDDYPAARVFAGLNPEPMLVRSVDRVTGVAGWHQVKATPVHDADGEVVMAITVSDDVTAVKQAESAQRFLASASKLLGSSLDVETTLGRAAATAVPELADWCRVDVIDARGRLVPAALAHPEDAPAEHVELVRSMPRMDPSDARSTWRVVRSGRPVLVPDVVHADGGLPIGDERHAAVAAHLAVRSVAVVPLTAGDRTVGLLTLATTAGGRTLGEHELNLALELGRRAGIAVDHARVHATSRHIAETLQQSFLPRRLPDVPGATLAGRFRAAGPGGEVGGDFYDAFPARGGWMVVMGDVAGKGPEAATVTAKARDTMRTAAAYEEGPAAVLARLNATLGEDDPPPLCTAVAVLLAPGDDDRLRATISCAGNPRPHLVSGGHSELVGEYGTLLGAFDDGSWPEVTLELRDGESLVLYTDGVTDARGADDRFGQGRLGALLAASRERSADALAGALDDAVAAFEDGPQLDDLAVVVIRAGDAPVPVAAAAGAEERAVSRTLRGGRPDRG